ncbi:Flp family type IVb pilin [Actibacterium sp. 188UL27-1]|uniref:Flp family type IVb pilin n=1 Tax=Actibacterium sp. 188UL27-1 TaxID=2786961 RepID=UPI00195CD85F|nr:hypothetical protein [Actibacterium sp. 188UL27-1]MBM7068213.1 hypothetical protein [Actibacterium sp. 188UL27-1]
MIKTVTKFLKDEDGAVTVDWVVLTAAIVGLGIAVVGIMAQGTLTASGSLGSSLEALTVANY